MNASYIKSTIIAAAVLLVTSSDLYAVSLEEVSLGDEGKQTETEPQVGAETATDVSEPEVKRELSPDEWKFAIVTVKANWLDIPDAAKIRQEIQSGCTAPQYRELVDLNPDPLSFGPSLALGRPSTVARFTSANELGEQIAWLKAHGLLVSLTSTGKISDGGLVNIPLVRELMSANESTNPFWEVRLFQDRVTANYVAGPFKRLQISRVLKNDLADTRPNPSGYFDITKLEIGSEVAGDSPNAFTLHFFPLIRDEVIREQLASVSDVVAFIIVYPGNAEFSRVLKESRGGNTKTFQFRYKFGDFVMGVHEQATPVHGWGPGIDLAENTVLGTQIETLQAELNALRSNTPPALDAATKQPDMALLRKHVGHAFDVRQQLQELEAKKLRLKLQLIETNLAARQKNRADIIERRVEQLLTSGNDSSSKQKAVDPPNRRIEMLVFGAQYSEPFQKMKPIVKSMMEDGLPVRIVDITTESELARLFKIDRIPTVVVTMDGQESRRFDGLRSEAELRRELRGHTWESESQNVTILPVESSDAPPSPVEPEEAGGSYRKDSTQTMVTTPANAQGTAAAMIWRQPSEIISELRKAHTMIELRNRGLDRSALKEKIQKLSEKKLSEKIGTEESANIELEIKKLEAEDALAIVADEENLMLMRNWSQTWSEYQTHVRLLRLNVDAAKASLELLIKKLDRLKRLFEKGAVTEFETEEAETRVQIAEIELRRAVELLQLYADIETNEPHLNPGYQAPSVESTTDTKAE